MEDKRKLILDAATLEFAEVGLNESSLETVARRAGLEMRAVRSLFIDKSTLLRELLREATDPLMSGVALAVNSIDDPRTMIQKTLELYDLWLFDHQDIVRIFTRCALDSPQWLGELYQRSLLPSEFYERLQQVIDKGQIRCKDMFTLNVILDALIMFPHMFRTAVKHMNPEQPAEETLRLRLDAVVDLFENGIYAD